MTVIEELRLRAGNHGGRQGAPSIQGRNSPDHSSITKVLDRVREYLAVLSGQLNIVKPLITADYALEGVGTLTRLRYGDFILSHDVKDHYESVALKFRAVAERSSARKKSKDLGRTGAVTQDFGVLPGFAQSVGEWNFDLDEGIPVEVSVEADYQTNTLKLVLKNIPTLGEQRFHLPVDAVDDSFIDELGNLVLRQGGCALLLGLENVSRAKSEMYEGEDISLVEQTSEVSMSALQPIVGRAGLIEFSSNEEIIEADSTSMPFRMGRSASCNIVVDSDVVSREHLIVDYRYGKFVLIDRSRNGTFVKLQEGRSIILLNETLPISGTGLISLGGPISVSAENLIYFSCG